MLFYRTLNLTLIFILTLVLGACGPGPRPLSRVSQLGPGQNNGVNSQVGNDLEGSAKPREKPISGNYDEDMFAHNLEDQFQKFAAKPQNLVIDSKAKRVQFTAEVMDPDGKSKKVELQGQLDTKTGIASLTTSDSSTEAYATCLDINGCKKVVVDMYQRTQTTEGEAEKSPSRRQFLAEKADKNGEFIFREQKTDDKISERSGEVPPHAEVDAQFEDASGIQGQYVGALPKDVIEKRMREKRRILEKVKKESSPEAGAKQDINSDQKTDQKTQQKPSAKTSSNNSDGHSKIDNSFGEIKSAASAPGISADVPPQAVGFVDRGHLMNATYLPLKGRGFVTKGSESHTEKDLEKAKVWGTTLLVDAFQWMAAILDQRFPGRPPLVVGDLSRKAGGFLGIFDFKHNKWTGHKSHQNGSDLDVGYPTTIDSGSKTLPSFLINGQINSVIDIERFWASVLVLNSHPDFLVLFVTTEIKKSMCKIVKDSGVPMSSMKDPAFIALNRMQEWEGHESHFHIRYQCPDTSPRCVTVKFTSLDKGTGCPR